MDRPQDPCTRPAVSVVIPCRNEASTVGLVLDALRVQALLPTEVIVVDDRSTDTTRSVVERWAGDSAAFPVIIVDGPGTGPAGAMNAGIRAASGTIIVRLDGHCRPQPDYVSRAVATLMRDAAGVVGGVWEIAPSGKSRVARAIAAVAAHPAGSGGSAYRNALQALAVRETDTVPFGCFLRSTWKDVGGYDEGLASNEDYDFNYRIRQSGRTVLLDTAVRSQYSSRPTLAALARQYFRYGFWKTQMLRKSPRALKLRQVAPALLLPWLVLTIALALTLTDVATLFAASLYPGLAIAAGVVIAFARHDRWLACAATAALVVQHTAWSAGFWHGLIWPPKPALSSAPDLAPGDHGVVHIAE